MQIGPINSTSFGNGTYTNPSHDNEFNGEYNQGSTVFENDYFYDKTDKNARTDEIRKHSDLSDKIKKIRNNVRPETCILACATIILAAIKGKKIADFAIKGGTIALGAMKAGAKEVFGTLGYAVKKITKKAPNKEEYFNILKENALEALDKGIEKSKKIGAPNETFVNKIQEIAKAMLGDKTGESVANFVTEKMGINSKSGLLAATAAGAIGYKASDTIGDTYEDIKDKQQIADLIKCYNGVV